MTASATFAGIQPSFSPSFSHAVHLYRQQHRYSVAPQSSRQSNALRSAPAVTVNGDPRAALLTFRAEQAQNLPAGLRAVTILEHPDVQPRRIGAAQVHRKLDFLMNRVRVPHEPAHETDHDDNWRLLAQRRQSCKKRKRTQSAGVQQVLNSITRLTSAALA